MVNPPKPLVFLEGSIYKPRLRFTTNPMLPYTTRVQDGWILTTLTTTASRILDDYTLTPTPAMAGEKLSDLQKPLLAWHRQLNTLIVLPRLAGTTTTRNLLDKTAKWCPGDGYYTITRETATNTNPKHILRSPLAAQHLTQATPTIPDWFGLSLYDFQREAAVLAASGHRLIAEPMGLGKTRIALAAAACHQPKKLLIITPPVMISEWQKQATTSRITPNHHPTVIIAKTRDWVLPDTGIIITTDTLLTSREGYTQQLQNWGPDVIIIDEAHRIKNPKTKRAKQIRALTRPKPTPVYCLTGTPMLATPTELIPLLEATHTMHWFKNTGAFLKTYTYKTPWGQHVARRKQLPQLKNMLDQHVWVRHPQDIIQNIPEMVTQTITTNPNLSLYRQAHQQVIEAIQDWLNTLPALPDDPLIRDWCTQALPHVSRLRIAAGRCKIPPAQELIRDWIDTHPKNPDTNTFDEPLIVWTHHREVMDALIDTTPASIKPAIIRGGTNPDETAKIVDAFQAGLIPVLYASIHAAGVGVTLTRATHALFVETDWTPAIIAQAQARIRRIGQTKTTISQTLIAPGTLDQTILKILGDKARVLTPVLGDHQDMRPEDSLVDTVPARLILEAIVRDTIHNSHTH